MLQEAQQARIDRSLSNTLIAQTAKDWQPSILPIAVKVYPLVMPCTQQAGLLIMPGGVPLGDEKLI